MIKDKDGLPEMMHPYDRMIILDSIEKLRQLVSSIPTPKRCHDCCWYRTDNRFCGKHQATVPLEEVKNGCDCYSYNSDGIPW